MSDGYDVYEVSIIQINNGKRVAVEDKAAGSVEILRPAVGYPADSVNCIGDRGDKTGAGVSAALQVPVVSTLNLQPRQRVKAIRLTSRH